MKIVELERLHSCKVDIFQKFNNSVLKNTSFIAKTATIIPNPATDYFSIQLPTNAETFYEIYDSNGKLLIENRVENAIPISVNQLQKGFYFVVIRFLSR